MEHWRERSGADKGEGAGHRKCKKERSAGAQHGLRLYFHPPPAPLTREMRSLYLVSQDSAVQHSTAQPGTAQHD